MKPNFFSTQPFFTILLPVFFVLHSWNQYQHLIHAKDTLLIAVILIGLSLFTFFVCLLCWKNKLKAAHYSFILMLFFLFYGYIHDQLQLHARFLSRHHILLLSIFFILILSLIFLSKRNTSQLRKMALLFNSCLLILCIYEIILLPKKNSISVNTKTEGNQQIGNQQLPNIYIIVFDEYASSKSLKRDYNYDNSALDSFLLSNQFFLMRESKSNYLRTNLSIASLLNYSYTSGLAPREKMTAEDMYATHTYIKYNQLFSLVKSFNYQIYNYTIFDTEKSPSKVKNEYLFHNERIIISNTMIGRLTNDLGPNVKTPFLKKILGTEITPNVYRRYNQRATEALLADLNKQDGSAPKLTYAHFLMPHPPFLYKANLEPVNPDTIKIDNFYDKKYIPQYLAYIPHTNSQLMKVINEIMRKENGNSIIFLLGDHGYKVMNDSSLHRDHYFSNLQALYLPDRNFKPLSESSTPINVMRHIINTAFDKKLPFLVDSSIMIGNKW
jgi:hypothetical protein